MIRSVALVDTRKVSKLNTLCKEPGRMIKVIIHFGKGNYNDKKILIKVRSVGIKNILTTQNSLWRSVILGSIIRSLLQGFLSVNV